MLAAADNSNLNDALRWYVVYTHLRQEDRVVKNLRVRHLETFSPRVKEHGFVRIGEKLKFGDRVVIKRGLFESFVGVFERELSDRDRISILLSVSFQNRFVIERELITKID